MGAVERHYIRRNNVIFLLQDEDKRRFKKGNDDRIKLPTLSTRYQSPYYIESAQANKTQVVVKIVSRTSGASCVNRLGDYIARDISVEDSKILGKEGHEIEKNEYLYLEDENGNIYASKDERRALIKEWSADFKGQESYQQQEWKDERLAQMKQELNNMRATSLTKEFTDKDKERYFQLEENINKKQYVSGKGKVYDLNVYLPKDTTHMVLSVGGQPKNKRELKKATNAVRNYLNKNVGDLGHRYLFTAHNDTDNLHFHVIIKNCNEFDRKMLRYDKADLFMLRQTFAKELERAGFERGAELRKDREHTLEKVSKGLERLHQNQTWYQNQMSKDSDRTFDAFSYRAMALNKTKFLLGALSAEDKHTNVFEIGKLSKMGDLRKEINQFKKNLLKISPNQLDAEKEALANKLAKESKFLANKVKHIHSYDYDDMQAEIKAKKEKHIESASLYLEGHKKALEKGYKDLGDKKYEPFFENLYNISGESKQLLKEIKACKSKSKDKGLDLGF